MAGEPDSKEGANRFFELLNVPFHFVSYHCGHRRKKANNIRAFFSKLRAKAFDFPWERHAKTQHHIQNRINWAIAQYGIEALVIDYFPSALYIHLPRADIATVLITLNREGDFYRDQIRLAATRRGSLHRLISLYRWRRRERKTYAAVDKVVTIGPSDLPKHEVRSTPICITPYLDPKPQQWRYSAGYSAFFVGDINHYPNRLAIEWITRRLAPALLNLDDKIRIKIVGATVNDFSAKEEHPNINFLGRSGGDTVSALFHSADLMLCPIQNDYGVKFKAIEALCYGTPVFASRQTLVGLPHLRGMPAIDLAQPLQAANIMRDLISQPEKLKALQQLQQQQQADFIGSQSDIWSHTLGKIRR
jgi:glycosyltransferase involved in cell wall biosynthesis